MGLGEFFSFFGEDEEGEFLSWSRRKEKSMESISIKLSSSPSLSLSELTSRFHLPSAVDRTVAAPAGTAFKGGGGARSTRRREEDDDDDDWRERLLLRPSRGALDKDNGIDEAAAAAGSEGAIRRPAGVAELESTVAAAISKESEAVAEEYEKRKEKERMTSESRTIETPTTTLLTLRERRKFSISPIRLHLHFQRTPCALSWSLFSLAERQSTTTKDNSLTMLERG